MCYLEYRSCLCPGDFDGYERWLEDTAAGRAIVARVVRKEEYRKGARTQGSKDAKGQK
jgi:hypothetical protein